MFCTQCGSQNAGGAAFCSQCGLHLADPNSEHAQPSPNPSQSPTPPQASAEPSPGPRRHGPFGAKKELESEVERLQAVIDGLGLTERDALQRELVQLRTEVPALCQERDDLQAAVTPLRTETVQLQKLKSQADTLQADVSRLTAEKSSLDASVTELQGIKVRIVSARTELTELQASVVETQDLAILQEVGLYQFTHVLENAVAYRDRLREMQDYIKQFNRAGGGAITATTNWTVNGSTRDGQRMVNEVSKLMLRAYNGEVDDAVRTLKPYKLQAAIDRLN
jgi:hypothetical protein